MSGLPVRVYSDLPNQLGYLRKIAQISEPTALFEFANWHSGHCRRRFAFAPSRRYLVGMPAPISISRVRPLLAERG